MMGMLLLFPVIIHDSYFDILEMKQLFFAVGTLLAVLCMLMVKIFRPETDGSAGNVAEAGIKPNMIYVAGFLFLASAVFSTFFSPYWREAFLGNQGRYQGLLTLILYGMQFYIIANNKENDVANGRIFIIGALAVLGLGIGQYFLADPFGWLGEVQEFERPMFFSTIGYSNFFSCYASMAAAFSMGMYLSGRERNRFFWLGAMAVSAWAIWISGSDGGLLAFASAYLIAPWLLRPQDMLCRRHLLAGAVFSGMAVWVKLCNEFLHIPSRSLHEGMAATLINGGWMPAAVLVLLVLLLIAVKAGKSRMMYDYPFMASATAMAALFLFFLAEDSGKLAFLRNWGNGWGSGRGMIWVAAIKKWRELDILHLLCGIGPDTAGLFLESEKELFQTVLGNAAVDNVHNEYLQYLVTTGISGLTAYLFFIALCLKKMWNSCRIKPGRSGVFLAAAAYLVQAAVSVNQSVTTPFLVLFLAWGMEEV